MSFTFEITLAKPKDRLRFRLGDTDADNPLLEDETIEAVLALQNDDENAALRALAHTLIAKVAAMPTREKIGDTETQWADRLAVWRSIANAYGPGFTISAPSRGDSSASEFST